MLDVEIQTLEPQPALTIRFRVPSEKIAEKLGDVLPAVFNYAVNNALGPGLPFARYHEFGSGTIDAEAGLSIETPDEGEGDICATELPGGSTAVTMHMGPYELLKDTHASLIAWAEKHGRKPKGGHWEVYITDPVEEPDSTQWKTKIYQPLAD